MRLTPDERRERNYERVLQTLAVCGGWMTVSMIHPAAFGGDSVTAAERDDCLERLEAAHMIESREVSKTVGRFGRTTRQYRYLGVSVDDVINSEEAVPTALSTESCDCRRMSLDTGARLALLDLAMGLVALLAETAS